MTAEMAKRLRALAIAVLLLAAITMGGCGCEKKGSSDKACANPEPVLITLPCTGNPQPALACPDAKITFQVGVSGTTVHVQFGNPSNPKQKSPFKDYGKEIWSFDVDALHPWSHKFNNPGGQGTPFEYSTSCTRGMKPLTGAGVIVER